MDTPIVPLKQCSKCGKWKPHTNKFFRVRDTFTENKCRACLNEYRNSLRRTKDTRISNLPDEEGYKVCSQCGIRKKLAFEFHRKGSNYTSHCKDCRNKHNRTYYLGDRQHHKFMAYAWRAANPERAKENERRWNQEHKEQRCASVRRYQKAHPEVKRSAASKRRAKERESEGNHTLADIRLLLKASKGRCWWCGKKIKGQYHIDHRVPLAKGGSNDASNLCVSCPKCNLSKHDKLPSEWSDRLL